MSAAPFLAPAPCAWDHDTDCAIVGCYTLAAQQELVHQCMLLFVMRGSLGNEVRPDFALNSYWYAPGRQGLCKCRWLASWKLLGSRSRRGSAKPTSHATWWDGDLGA